MIRFALPLLLCATTAVAQPVSIQDEVRREVESQFGERLRDLELKSTVAVTLLGINIVGIIPAYFYLLHRARKMVDQKLAAVIESRPGALLGLLDEREADQRLRRETPILVIASGLATEGALREAGFSQVTTVQPDRAQERKLAPATIVVFDLANGCSEELAASLLESKSLASALVYTTARSSLSAPGLTYANSPVTLVSRLLELIRSRKALGS